jgi:DICT domain-containing protein
MKPQVTVQLTTDKTVLDENYHRTPTALGHQLVDLLRAATAPAALVVIAVQQLMVMLTAEAAAAGAPHTRLEEESVAEAIAEAEATQTATSQVSHVAAMMPAVELKKFDARSVGVSPRGPLKQRGNPHLNPGTETR